MDDILKEAEQSTNMLKKADWNTDSAKKQECNFSIQVVLGDVTLSSELCYCGYGYVSP